MAIPVLPSNGFITRLLQQTSQAPTIQNQQNKTSERSISKPDQMNISQEAREANKESSNAQLEAKLIELYNQKGQGKG